MENANKEWKDIETKKESGNDSIKETLKPLTREDYEDNQPSLRNNIARKSAKEVRESLFGNSCHYCGKIEEGKRMVIHRKDGRPHDSRILSSAKYLRNLNSDKWVALCNKCQRQVKWAEDTLEMGWDDLN